MWCWVVHTGNLCDNKFSSSSTICSNSSTQSFVKVLEHFQVLEDNNWIIPDYLLKSSESWWIRYSSFYRIEDIKNFSHYLSSSCTVLDFICCLCIFTVFTTFVATLALYIGTLHAARVTHNFLLKKILRAPMEFFDQTPIGRIINRFSKDVEAVDSDLPATLRAFTACFFGVLHKIICSYFIIRCWDLVLRRCDDDDE